MAEHLITDKIEQSTIAAVKKILPLSGRVRLAGVRTSKSSKVQRSPVAGKTRESGEEGEGEGEGEEQEKKDEEEIDLREIINRKSKKNSERYDSVWEFLYKAHNYMYMYIHL